MKVHFMPERAPPSFRQVIDAEQSAGHTVLVVLPRRLEHGQPLGRAVDYGLACSADISELGRNSN